MKTPKVASAVLAAALLLLLITWLASPTAKRGAPAGKAAGALAIAPRSGLPVRVTNETAAAHSAELTAWRRNFSPAPASDRIPTAEEFAIRLESRVIDTSVDSARGRTTRGARLNGAALASQSGQIPSSRGVQPYIVQFDGAIQDSWKTAVREAGGILRGYLPNNAFLVELDAAALDRVAGLPPVRWIGEYKPEYKVQPFLNYLAGRLAGSADAADAADRPNTNRIEISVRTFDPRDVAEVRDQLVRAGVNVTASAGGRAGASCAQR